jgi:hypothetical protein
VNGRAGNRLLEQPRQFLAYLGLLWLAGALAVAGRGAAAPAYRAYLGGLNPSLAVVSAAVLCGAPLAVLVRFKQGFEVCAPDPRPGLARAVLLACLFGAVAIAGDTRVGFPRTMNVASPTP